MGIPVRTYSPEWFKIRRQHLGASEIGALMGLSPYETAASVWDSKHNDRHIRPDAGPNTRLWWGHKDEPAIITAAMHELRMTDMWDTQGWAWAAQGFMVSPDAVITERFVKPENMIGNAHAVIEAKSVGKDGADKWVNGPPHHIVAQVYGQIVLMGVEKGYVAARIAGDPVRTWEIPSSPEVAEAIHQIIDEFWKHKEPPTEWEEFIFEVMKPTGWLTRKPESSPREIELEDAQILFDWMGAQQAKRNAEKLIDDMRPQLEQLFGENDSLTFMGSPLMEARTYKRGNFDRTQLALDHPELHDQYSHTTEYTVYKKTPNLENLR